MSKNENRYSYATLLLGLLLPAAIAGCSYDKKKETAYIPGGGKVSVEESAKTGETKTTIKSDKGEVTLTSKAAAADFDVPFYPGAEQENSGAISMSAQTAQGSGRWSAVVLKSKDPFEKVLKFYKDNMAGTQTFEATTDEGQTATLIKGKGDKEAVSTVLISRNKNESETKIHITRVTEK